MTVLLTDAGVTSVPVRECGEPLVPVPRAVAYDGDRPLVRSGVAAALSAAQLVLPPGRRLFVAEGHRSAVAQAAIWRSYLAEMQRLHPGSSADEQRRLASRFVAPSEVAPHVAGAAIDVTLVDRFGVQVEMGTPIDATIEQSAGACCFVARVSPAARAERATLADALSSAGFTNYPTEWRHWSLGDRYWAWATRASAARYGPVEDGLTDAGWRT